MQVILALAALAAAPASSFPAAPPAALVAQVEEPPPEPVPKPPAAPIQRPPEPAGVPSAEASDPIGRVVTSRPRFQVAIGLGLSVDRAAAHPDGGLPAFFFSAGLGDGIAGLELRSFANGATQQQVIRLSFDLVGVLRPLALAFPAPSSYGARVLRSVGVGVGPGLEIATYNRRTDRRTGLVTGAQLDLPFGGPGGASEVRLRLGFRRFLGGKITFDQGHQVGDTVVEVYGQLAFVF
jgi:hypothetical protein